MEKSPSQMVVCDALAEDGAVGNGSTVTETDAQAELPQLFDHRP
jgi:hypothetical protein